MFCRIHCFNLTYLLMGFMHIGFYNLCFKLKWVMSFICLTQIVGNENEKSTFVLAHELHNKKSFYKCMRTLDKAKLLIMIFRYNHYLLCHSWICFVHMSYGKKGHATFKINARKTCSHLFLILYWPFGKVIELSFL